MLILIAHGSRDPQWRGSLERLTRSLARDLPSGEGVALAFMQFAGPTLPDVVGAAFMASAGHVDKDIKPLVEELRRTHPGTTLELLTPVGEDDLFPGLLLDIAKRPGETG